MNKRLLSIVIAVAMAAGAVVLINMYLKQQQSKYQVQLEETAVVIAVQPIQKGATIDQQMVKAVSWPIKYVQPNVLQNPMAAVGKISLVDISPNQQILGSYLTLVRKTEDSLSVRLPSGKRACNVRFSDPQVTTIAGGIKPADFVDIIGIFPYVQNVAGKTIEEKVSVTLFQNVQVLGIQGDVFTFSMSPQDAALLSYAMSTKDVKLQLVLRNPLDSQIQPISPVEANALWQYIMSSLGQQLVQPAKEKEEKAKEPPPPPPVPKVDIYKGTEKTSVELAK